MKLFIGRLLMGCMGVILLAGCNSMPDQAEANPGEWMKAWLENPVCNPPCFENIIPGETKYNDAIEIIETNPDFTITSKKGSSYDYHIYFKNNESNDEAFIKNSEFGFGAIHIKLVSHSLSLAQIIDQFGEPDDILFAGCFSELPLIKPACDFEIIYKEGLLSFQYIGEEYKTKRNFRLELHLDDSSIFGDIWLNSNEMESEYLMGEYQLIPWNGYGEYLIEDTTIGDR